MGIIHGAEARPRAIFQGLDPQVIEELIPLVGSYVEVTAGGQTEIDQREYDLFVTTQDVQCSRHLHVLALGSDLLSGLHGNAITSVVLRHTDVTAAQLNVPDEVSQAIRDLIIRTLVPVVEERPRPRWKWDTRRLSPLREGDVAYTPLLTSHAHDEVLAFVGRFKRNDQPEGGMVLALPAIPTEVAPWLRWFLDIARKVTPEAFPVHADWQEDPRWGPPGLQDVLAERSALQAERLRLLAELDQRAEALDAKVADEMAAAETGIWRLLTKQHEEFEDAVGDALEELGFAVERRNAVIPDGQPKYEDLRISDPSEPGWVALAECKGLTKGAKAGAVRQLSTRPVHAFVLEQKRAPDALYYIVNHTISTPPPDRPEPLDADAPTISLLAEQGGAVIDSRALLQAQITALLDPQAKPKLRAAMRESRGRWDGTIDATTVGLDDEAE
ncbi:hypothetical protein [Myceligenerans salitolerans]|uniref:Restriction endonuclease type IV Mrr domain-containing protein n=1 Tax=Myceligenerans salitolerans TaxID=1230528 RepID=A0ABS3IDN9_9MICO|nr:hypothetical protein [Myceligenerans salitolerans]MBO0611094.1 hypothetical protein [Myceligenerans salitolerans]